jgi:hypothetical protein
LECGAAAVERAERWLKEPVTIPDGLGELDLLQRSLLLTDDCLLDWCTVTAPHAKTIDCLLHAAADSVAIADAPSAPSAEPLGRTG